MRVVNAHVQSRATSVPGSELVGILTKALAYCDMVDLDAAGDSEVRRRDC